MRPGRPPRARGRSSSLRAAAADAHTRRLRNYRRKGDREKGVRARGKDWCAPRPPKVKSRDGRGPGGDRALRDAKSKREVKRVRSLP